MRNVLLIVTVMLYKNYFIVIGRFSKIYTQLRNVNLILELSEPWYMQNTLLKIRASRMKKLENRNAHLRKIPKINL